MKFNNRSGIDNTHQVMITYRLHHNSLEVYASRLLWCYLLCIQAPVMDNSHYL